MLLAGMPLEGMLLEGMLEGRVGGRDSGLVTRRRESMVGAGRKLNGRVEWGCRRAGGAALSSLQLVSE